MYFPSGIIRSNRLEVKKAVKKKSGKKGFLKSFAKFTRKDLCQSLLKLQAEDK